MKFKLECDKVIKVLFLSDKLFANSRKHKFDFRDIPCFSGGSRNFERGGGGGGNSLIN